MRQREVFHQYPVFLQILYFAAICIGCLTVSNGIASLLVILAGGEESLQSIGSLLFVQTLSSIGGFLLPALWLAWMKKAGQPDYLHIRTEAGMVPVLAGIAFLILATPLVSALQGWGENWQNALGGGLGSYFQQKSLQSGMIVDKLLHVESWGVFLCSFFVIAVVAGICEEFLFRGGLQNLLAEWFKNKHVAIWVASMLFSAFHLDLAGFLPRCLLGAILGYTYAYSGCIWVPVILHTLNNGVSCLMAFLYFKGYAKIDPDLLGQSLGPEWTLVSLAGLVFLAIFIFRTNKLKKTGA